ncbi:hypothetical protein Bhyg_10823 [Pseudolycoriella hygida]|uniref:Uncharacterized protein n=1 Tax=Pseudolycoriella hygida TaxID=35572 RepID=A0A9Q0MVV6_9DIPT|nr:hypothetical protein Bhyg_10823 [Pseudolycoriella hygida]
MENVIDSVVNSFRISVSAPGKATFKKAYGYKPLENEIEDENDNRKTFCLCATLVVLRKYDKQKRVDKKVEKQFIFENSFDFIGSKNFMQRKKRDLKYK